MLDNMTFANTQLENYKEYKQIANTYFIETKKFQHDLNNNVVLLTNLLENDKTDTALELLKEHTSKLQSLNLSFSTGNDLLDFIFSQKLTYAENKSVKLEAEITLLNSIYIQQNHIVALLFNQLDNAIDSAAQSIDKKVNIEILAKNEVFKVIVENSTLNITLALKNIKEMRSNKANDNFEHGIGLIIINTVVENYNGIFEVEKNKDLIQISVLLNNKIQKHPLNRNKHI